MHEGAAAGRARLGRRRVRKRRGGGNVSGGYGRDVDAMVKVVAVDPGNCRLLEPWYRFRLEVPSGMIGRAMADVQRMSGTFAPPMDDGEYAVIAGGAPLSEMCD